MHRPGLEQQLEPAQSESAFQEKDSGGACRNNRHAKTMRAGGSIVKQYLIRPNLNQAGGPSRSEGVDALRSLDNESGKTYGSWGEVVWSVFAIQSV